MRWKIRRQETRLCRDTAGQVQNALSRGVGKWRKLEEFAVPLGALTRRIELRDPAYQKVRDRMLGRKGLLKDPTRKLFKVYSAMRARLGKGSKNRGGPVRAKGSPGRCRPPERGKF